MLSSLSSVAVAGLVLALATQVVLLAQWSLMSASHASISFHAFVGRTKYMSRALVPEETLVESNANLVETLSGWTLENVLVASSPLVPAALVCSFSLYRLRACTFSLASFSLAPHLPLSLSPESFFRSIRPLTWRFGVALCVSCPALARTRVWCCEYHSLVTSLTLAHAHIRRPSICMWRRASVSWPWADEVRGSKPCLWSCCASPG